MADKALVTGGAGFIGSNLARRLHSEGSSVRILDDLSTGNPENLHDIRADIEFIQGDIRELPVVQACAEGMDFIFHLAAIPSVTRSIENPLHSNDININGTLNVLIAARDMKVRRLIFSSSASIYGNSPGLPKRESMSPTLQSPYALNKLTGEYYCKIFCDVFGLETISLRYFNIFGPRQDPASEYAAVIPRFINALLEGKSPIIYGDGEQTRDFTFVDNVVEANIRAAHIESACGEVVNVAAGHRTSLNQLLENLNEIIGENIAPEYAEARIGDVRHSLADIAWAKQLLGYRLKVDFKEGLKRTVDWFRRLSPNASKSLTSS